MPELLGTSVWKGLKLDKGWVGLILCMMWEESRGVESRWYGYFSKYLTRIIKHTVVNDLLQTYSRRRLILQCFGVRMNLKKLKELRLRVRIDNFHRWDPQ